MSDTRRTGFALIEAIVAIAVLSMTLLAAYGWINVSIEMLVKSDDMVTQELAIDRLTDQLRHHDFGQSTGGSFQYENLEFEWQAHLLEPIRPGKNMLGRTGLFDHGLYLVDINVSRLSHQIASYSVRIVHSERVREPRFEL